MTRNTLGITQTNGENNNKMFFTSHLQKLGKISFVCCLFLFGCFVFGVFLRGMSLSGKMLFCFQLQFDTKMSNSPLTGLFFF